MANKFDTGKMKPQELAAQLRRPEGSTGKEIGLKMNQGNRQICLNTYQVLSPNEGDHILEIGMGNGFFIKDLLSMNSDMNYTGVDYSDVMVDEASSLNSELIEKGLVNFHHASIEEIPLTNASVDCICTTNTLYFWPEPLKCARELLRVLKPGGKLVIGYRDKDFMDRIELANYGFVKYSPSDAEDLLSKAGFAQISTQKIKEDDLDINGDRYSVEGCFTIGIK